MIVLLTAFLVALPQQDRPTVKAELVPRSVRVGEAVVLRISVRSRGGGTPRIETPRLHEDLHTAGTQDFTEMSMSANRRVTVTRREFVLVPQSTGTFNIPALRVTINRQVHRTSPLKLEVVAAPEEEAPLGEVEEARLLVRMEPETVYVGQQATLIGEVLFLPDLQMRLTRPPTYDAPAPAEFWVSELPPDAATDMRMIDGHRYVVQRSQRAYFPLTPGRFAFAPARVTYEARQGFLFAPQTRELRSESPRLTVLPVPENGRPASFSGAVGTLSMKARVEPRTGGVGDAVSLTVEITGTGNMKSLPPPELPELPGFDVLDPAETTDLDPRARQISGTKRFTWVLVPEKEGSFELPAIEYSSFDPELRAFRRHAADPGSLTVLPAGAVTPGAGAVPRLREEREKGPLDWVRSRLFLAAQVAPLGLIAMALLARRRRTSPLPRLKRGWDQRLAALRAARSNPLTHADRLLRDALAELIPAARARSGSPAELQHDLRGLVSPEFADSVARLLERLEHARYAPGDVEPGERNRILDALSHVLDAAWRHARQTAPARSAMLPLPLLLVMAQAPDGTLFDQGIAAYREQRFAVAVPLFAEYVASEKNDPAGWYNLALAYEANLEPARAAWALLHAAELRPRDREIDAQLTRLGASRATQRVRPLLRINTEETWLLASTFWWLAAGLLALGLARRRRGWALSSLLPLALAGLLLLSWVVERVLPASALVMDRGAALLAGRSLHADLVRQLQPLSGLTVLEDRDGWIRVRTATGERGWLSADAVVRFP